MADASPEGCCHESAGDPIWFFCGSAGVIPAIVSLLRHHHKLPTETMRRSLLASAAVGFIAKQNASISGAEVGCQGEIGVPSSMGAVKTNTAYLIAREGLPQWHIVGFDKAVEAMKQTGRDMKSEYRETSPGGLARCC